MKKIDIYVENKDVLFETYNKEFVSSNLIEYILNKTTYLKKNEDVSLILHVTKETKGCSLMIRKGLQEEYRNNVRNHNIMNIKQTLLLLLGLCLLFISTLIDDTDILNEVILIGAWVPIWEAIELELLTDTKEKRKRKQLKKLLECNIEEVEL